MTFVDNNVPWWVIDQKVALGGLSAKSRGLGDEYIDVLMVSEIFQILYLQTRQKFVTFLDPTPHQVIAGSINGLNKPTEITYAMIKAKHPPGFMRSFLNANQVNACTV